MDQGENPSQGSRRTADGAGAAAPSPLPSGSSNEAEFGKQQSESERPTESLLPSLEGETLDNSAADAERLEKISKLKKAIAGGTYHVSAAELARKLIEHMREPKPEPKG
jgi:anti-sigma28 factor (negative regulator of flagellin synthesis)